jgi:hypothetical protein
MADNEELCTVDELSEFSHIRDGSEPGWSLAKGSETVWSISVAFPEGGPTVHAVQALRRALPQFGIRPGSIRGKAAIVVARSVGNIECRRIVSPLHKHDLMTGTTSTILDWTLPNSPDRSALLINDENLSRAVASRMVKEGLPVHQVEVD